MKEWFALGTGRVNWVELAKEAYQFVKQAGGNKGSPSGRCDGRVECYKTAFCWQDICNFPDSPETSLGRK
jgi:hypothetical protein